MLKIETRNKNGQGRFPATLSIAPLLMLGLSLQPINLQAHGDEEIGSFHGVELKKGDLEGALEQLTDDIVFRPIGTHPDLGREFKGKEDMLQNCWMRVFQHIDGGVVSTIKNFVAAKGIAMAEFSGTGTGRRGMPYNNEYVHVLHFRGDKICSITEYLDTALLNELLEQ